MPFYLLKSIVLFECSSLLRSPFFPHSFIRQTFDIPSSWLFYYRWTTQSSWVSWNAEDHHPAFSNFFFCVGNSSLLLSQTKSRFLFNLEFYTKRVFLVVGLMAIYFPWTNFLCFFPMYGYMHVYVFSCAFVGENACICVYDHVQATRQPWLSFFRLCSYTGSWICRVGNTYWSASHRNLPLF